jgi:hypothetical protein
MLGGLTARNRQLDHAIRTLFELYSQSTRDPQSEIDREPGRFIGQRTQQPLLAPYVCTRSCGFLQLYEERLRIDDRTPEKLGEQCGFNFRIGEASA